MKVIVLPRADADLEDIGDYIAQDNPDRAASFVAELRSHCASVAGAPKAFRIRPELRNLRCCPYGNYLILFRLKRGEFQVVRIIHAARDARDLARHGNLNEPQTAYAAVPDFEALGFLRLPENRSVPFF